MSNIVPTNERAVEKIVVTNEKNRTLKSKKDTDLSSLLKRKSDRTQTTTYAWNICLRVNNCSLRQKLLELYDFSTLSIEKDNLNRKSSLMTV